MTHYSGVIMGEITSQITSLTIVYSIVYSGADQRKHQSSESLAQRDCIQSLWQAFVRGIHRRPASNINWKKFPFDDVKMCRYLCRYQNISNKLQKTGRIKISRENENKKEIFLCHVKINNFLLYIFSEKLVLYMYFNIHNIFSPNSL